MPNIGRCILFEEVALYRRAESYVSHHSTSKHQCTRLGLVLNLNSQATIPYNEGWKPPYSKTNDWTS